MDSNAYCNYTPGMTDFVRVCEDAVSFLPEGMRIEAFGRYYLGYRAWLEAGLPEITGTQLRAAGNCAPDAEDGIRFHINGVLNPENIILMRSDI